MKRLACVSGLILVLWAGLVGRSHADTVTVGCPGARGTFDYPSITAALDALAAVSHRDHWVKISGTCVESVGIQRFENLRLSGEGSASIVDPGASTPGYFGVMSVLGSRNVQIDHLTLRGSGLNGRTCLQVFDSTAYVNDCVIENGGGPGGGGAFIQGTSRVWFEATTVQDNQHNGIRVEGASDVQIGQVTIPNRECTIRRNASGVTVQRGASVGISGATSIVDNGTGVTISAGHVNLCCNDFERQVRNNSVGFVVENGGTLEFNGPVRVETNEWWGVYAVGGAVHVRYGPLFLNNGRRTQGGAIAMNHGTLDLGGGRIESNASGVLAVDGALARIQNTEITGNQGYGIRVEANASLRLLTGVTAKGNGNFDLSCTTDSSAHGDASGVERMSCPGFNQSLTCPAPGAVASRSPHE